MEKKYQVALAGVVILTAFAFGRYSAPEKIKIVKETAEVDNKKKDSETDVNKTTNKKTTIVEEVKPDGTTKKTTEIVEGTETNKQKTVSEDSQSIKTSKETKEIIKDTGRLNLGLLAGAAVTDRKLIYGAYLSRNVLGPITLGVWGFNNATFGASIGLSF